MRFSEAEFDTPAQMDFVPRERRGQITRVVVAFIIALVLLTALTMLPESLMAPNHAALIAMAIVLMLCFYIVYRKQQNLDLVMHTEYQNMLFAQAAALGSTFCLFVRRDGTIIYANDGLSKLFPQYAQGDSRALEVVFEQGGVATTDRARIMGAIYSNQSDRLVFPLVSPGGEKKDYILTLEPLQRPGGFMVVRGREYRDKRAGMQLLPDVLRATSADKLDHLLSTTSVAHYVTDSYGRFEYVNPATDQLLGYAAGEITTHKLSMHNVLYQVNGQPVTDETTLGDYTGPALLKKKSGELVQVLLQQSAIRDAQGKLLGTTGSALPH